MGQTPTRMHEGSYFDPHHREQRARHSVSAKKRQHRRRQPNLRSDVVEGAQESLEFVLQKYPTEGSHRRTKRSRPLGETDANAQRAASTAWKQSNRDRSLSPSQRTSRKRETQTLNDHWRYRSTSPRSRRRRDNQRTASETHVSSRPPRDKRNQTSKRPTEARTVRIEKPPRPRKDCIVCTESRSIQHFATRPPTAQCTHEVNTCRRCLRSWIESEFTSKMWDQINCPECSVRLEHEDMRVFAPPDIFRRYDRLSTRAALEAIPGFRWCIAKGCKSGQVHDEGQATPRFRCTSCRASHCVVHQVRWHKGETCAEYDYRTDGKLKKAEIEANKKWIQSTTKRCPGKDCRWNIEKNNGCDHMKCSKCKHEFCWSCLAPYGPIRNQGNHMHRQSCEYYMPG
ncbi:hypothetical protein EJ04DRAFT_242 [Polyplosphaeria fusca]|uniref:RBR-type E3 ubiquitin transferase n=1 Tax=Polyplosphaeria fusca TaxID=682080 RepID=A0A9P4R8Z8_9PLEO|nr:hypothetical protein EJ04DRAFT_242 [Polyplosphaeria fusca]